MSTRRRRRRGTLLDATTWSSISLRLHSDTFSTLILTVSVVVEARGLTLVFLRRHCSKATTLEPTYAPAWIGFGNSFAAQDESDQAMSSYRTASSLFPGSHLPPLYIGMEYVRTNNLVQAQEYLRQAVSICPTDPLVYNELGTVHYKRKEFARAIEMFNKALQLCRHLPDVRPMLR